MNNFTESLPKSGHVNEVCKEWLVREDSALAYKLQSQEINDFYKGNRFRNAVVREDFPTALHEQIKEKENAEKQAEEYRKRLMEQEEHDKCVAKEIAEKLERDLQEQQQRQLLESELIAQQMQEMYVNLPPVPPPGARDKSKPPPRPAKASILQQNQHEPSTSHARHHTQHQHGHYQQHQQEVLQAHQPFQQQQHHQQQHQHFSDTNGYVGFSLASTNTTDTTITTPSRQKSIQSNSNQFLVSDGETPVTTQPSSSISSPSSTSASASAFHAFGERPGKGRPTNIGDHYLPAQNHPQHRHQHSSSTASGGSASSMTSPSASAASSRHNVFDSINPNNPPTRSPHTPQSPHTPTKPAPITPHALLLHTPTTASTSAFAHYPRSSSIEELLEYSDVADSIRSYDITTDALDSSSTPPSASATHSPAPHSNFNRLLSPSNENLLRTDKKFQKLSPEKYDQLVGNQSSASGAAAERHMQQHADDIELYVDPCDYASLKEIGLPMEEIKEMSKKLKQEQKDELLARRLQELEAKDGMTQEERDRIMAIEAQDKELAKMLQERERAKAKRAKEKARLRKHQQKESSSLCGASNGLHCGPLLPLPQDCMSATKHCLSGPSSPANPSVAKLNAPPLRPDDPVELEPYSNPIDVLHSSQRTQNGTLTNGSLTREVGAHHIGRHGHSQQLRDDDIYTLPVDTCRTGPRPTSLSIGSEHGQVTQNNSMTRSENYSLDSHDSLSGHDTMQSRINYSKSGTFDQNASPTPPYMPIQGTRRSNSSEDRKKKTKDKCTHQ